jgi:hypothetical protein
MHFQYPRIKKALCRAIEHDLRYPGELSSFLEYMHLMAMNRSYETQLVEDKKRTRIEKNKYGT